MKKALLAITLISTFASAHATGLSFGNNYDDHSTTNAPKGGDASAISGASSVAEAKANAAALAAQQQSLSNKINTSVGVKNRAAGGKANVGDIDIGIGGDRYEAAASPVIPGNVPVISKSCRLYLFGGAITKEGGTSGTFPIGNDQTCLSGVNVPNMLAINQAYPETFSKEDVVQEQCKVEGMDTSSACKNLKQQ